MVRRGRRPHICTYHINLTRNRNGGPCSAAVSGPSIHGLLPVADDDLCFDCKGNYFPDMLSCKFCRFPENTRFFIVFMKNYPIFPDTSRFLTPFSQKQPCFFGNMPEKAFFRIFGNQHPYRHNNVLIFLFGPGLPPPDDTGHAAAPRHGCGASRRTKCYFVNNFLFQSTIIL